MKKIKFYIISLFLIFILTGCSVSSEELLNKANKDLASDYIEAKGYGSIKTNLFYKDTINVDGEISIDNSNIEILNDGDDSVTHIKGIYKTNVSNTTKNSFSAFDIDIKNKEIPFDIYADKDYLYINQNEIWNKSDIEYANLKKLLLLSPPKSANAENFEVKETKDGYELKGDFYGGPKLQNMLRAHTLFKDAIFHDIENDGDAKNNVTHGIITYTFNKKKKLISYKVEVTNLKVKSEDCSGSIDINTEIKYASFNKENKLSIPDEAKHSETYYEPFMAGIIQ